VRHSGPQCLALSPGGLTPTDAPRARSGALALHLGGRKKSRQAEVMGLDIWSQTRPADLRPADGKGEGRRRIRGPPTTFLPLPGWEQRPSVWAEPTGQWPQNSTPEAVVWLCGGFTFLLPTLGSLFKYLCCTTCMPGTKAYTSNYFQAAWAQRS
jgi:hypothetical protein